MTTVITDRHRCCLPAPVEVIETILERLGGPDDPLWPVAAWPSMVLDRSLVVGAEGRHCSEGVSMDVSDLLRRPPGQWQQVPRPDGLVVHTSMTVATVGK